MDSVFEYGIDGAAGKTLFLLDSKINTFDIIYFLCAPTARGFNFSGEPIDEPVTLDEPETAG
jgi:hypothetical protein